MRTGRFLFAVIGTAGLAVSAAHADQMELSFFNITNNGNTNVSSQLRCVVSSVAGEANKVDFTFRNLVGVKSSIKEVYFDDGTLLAGSILTQQGSSFVWGDANPGDLPGGNSLDVPFDVTAGFMSDSGNGGPSTGLNTNTDFLTIRFDLKNSQTYADIIAALFKDPALEGSLRIGLHVIAIGDRGGSDSYVNTPLVPLPPAAYAGLGMLGALAGAKHLRRRRLAAE